MDAVRGDVKEAREGRRRAKVEAAQLRVEVEALQKTGEDLQQRLGLAEEQLTMRSVMTPPP